MDATTAPDKWAYTSDDRPVITSGQTYLPYAISEGADLTRNTLDITVPLLLPLLDLFRPVAPLDPIGITLYRRCKGSVAAEMQ